MGDDDDGVLLLQLVDKLFHFGGGDGVEGGCRLVHQQDRRRHRHGTGYAETLLLTAGEGVGRDFQLVLHLIPKGGAFQGFFHPLTDEGVIGDAIHAESVGNVLEDAFGERIGTLEHHAHVLAEFVHLHSSSIDILSVNAYLAGQTGVGNQIVHAVQQAQEGRLSTARGTDEGYHRLLLNVHADAFQGMEIAIPEVHVTGFYLVLHTYCICFQFVLIFFSKYFRRAFANRFTRRIISISTNAVP